MMPATMSTRASTPRAAIAALMLALPNAGVAAAQVIDLAPLPRAPVIDGDLSDWKSVPGQRIVTVQVEPAVRGDERNVTGITQVDIRAGVHGDRLYLAVRWADEAPDTVHRPWEWNGTRYVRAQGREDMFALRLHLDGDFDSCMLAKRSYRADVWLWSAARTNPSGLAEDMNHEISVEPLEDAAEHEGPDGITVYIRKRRDAGTPFYEYVRAPKTFSGKVVESVRRIGAGSGSIADVKAKGVWKDGHWNLELSRALDTGHPDDAALSAGRPLAGNIAVFNRGYDQHKSVSGELAFRAPPR